MRTLPILLVLAACDYEAPIVPPLDVNGDPKAVNNVISGEVVLAVPSESLGPVIIFVTDASNPMPPYGTGRPVTISTVSPTSFNDAGGMVSAPWSVSNVPDGEYVITAMMDIDRDFSPTLTALAGATCGDIGGAHLTDLITAEFASVVVSGGELADDVTIVLASEFTLERPAFTLVDFGAGGEAIDSARGAADTTSQVYTVESTGIHYGDLVEIADPSAFGTEECGTIIPMYGVDDDGDGAIDPHPEPAYAEAGLKNTWPKIYIQYLGKPVVGTDGTVTFENELAAGERWAGENVISPGLVLLGKVKAGEFTYNTDNEGNYIPTDFLWLPGARHYYIDEATGELASEVVTDMEQLPKGAWSMTMVSITGQTWTVPNDLWKIDATDPYGQMQWLDVQ